jgi:hypothetical protein
MADAGVAAHRQAGIGDALPDPQRVHARTQGLDHARRFDTRHCRQARQRVEAGAVVDVHIVHADGGVPDRISPAAKGGSAVSVSTNPDAAPYCRRRIWDAVTGASAEEGRFMVWLQW